jgi:ribosomal protein S18 acetylase RimI-like enzyme
MSDGARFAGLDMKRVEEASLNGLQTQRQLFYDGWLLRLSPGKAKRARSVNAHFGSSLPLPQKIAYCERAYEQRGLPALFRITPFIAPRDLEDALAARGYEAFETTLVQLMALPRPPEIPAVAGMRLVVPSPARFVEAVGELQGATREQSAAHLERLAQTPLETRSIIAVIDGRPVGTGSVAMEDGLAGVYSLATAADMRARGIATSILGALLTWAWEHGVGHAYLQVDADNHRAISVYRKFGFEDAYTYHYRGRPGECH